MVARWIHPIYSASCLTVALVIALCPLAGCAQWRSERWNLDRYRDSRAIDIDQRLSTDEPIVQSPF